MLPLFRSSNSWYDYIHKYSWLVDFYEFNSLSTFKD